MADKMRLLAEQIARIEADGAARIEQPPPVPLECPLIDDALPDGGLARGVVHEMMGPGHNGPQQGEGALMGFATVSMARLMRADEHERIAVWFMNYRLLYIGGILSGWIYPPGLEQMGLPTHRLLMVYAKNDKEVLWGMEESLRSGAVSAVLGELTHFEPMAARRLQLAAQANGTTGLVLWPGKVVTASSFAETRWRLSNLPSLGEEIEAHWKVSLERARRSSVRKEWSVHWRNHRLEAVPFSQVEPLVPVPGGADEASPLIWPQSEPEERNR